MYGILLKSALINISLLLSWTDCAEDFENQQAVLQQAREVPNAFRMVRQVSNGH